MHVAAESISTLDHALAYAARGWRVMPVHAPRGTGCSCTRPDCSSQGKHPVPKEWQKLATSNPDGVRDLFRTAPADCNLGLATGAQDDGTFLLVIDADDAGRLAELEADHGALPPTRTSSTGRGRHLLYLLGPGQDPKGLGNRAGIGGKPGVDVRGKGGQIVLPPSRHKSGQAYTWASNVETAFLPDAWYRFLAPVRAVSSQREPVRSSDADGAYVRAALDGAARDIAATPDGARNATAFSKVTYAIKLANHAGIAWSRVEGMFEDAIRASGLEPRECTSVLRNARKTAGDEKIAPPARTWRPASAPVPEPGEPPPPPEDWTKALTFDRHNKLEKTIRNLVTCLEGSPLTRGKIRWNQLTKRIDGRDLPWTKGEWVDAHDVELQMFASAEWRCDWAMGTVRDAILAVAWRNRYHPIRTYLSGLTWDGTARLDGWLHTYLGAADSELNRVIGANQLVAAVARVMSDEPTQVDTVLVLEGAQGVRKSTALRALAPIPAAFADLHLTPKTLDAKDTKDTLARLWLVELAEVDGMLSSAREAGAAKALVTCQADMYRPPYGKHPDQAVRQCVLFGTTNKRQYHHDDSGARRFLPVPVTACSPERIVADRDQLWAEAHHRWKGGAGHHVANADLLAMLGQAQGNRFERDPWEERVIAAVTGPAPISGSGWSTGAVLSAIGLLDPALHTVQNAGRVKSILTRYGWKETRPRTPEGRIRVWGPGDSGSWTDD
jgi:predicted P-loop ATPase